MNDIAPTNDVPPPPPPRDVPSPQTAMEAKLAEPASTDTTKTQNNANSAADNSPPQQSKDTPVTGDQHPAKPERSIADDAPKTGTPGGTCVDTPPVEPPPEKPSVESKPSAESIERNEALADARYPKGADEAARQQEFERGAKENRTESKKDARESSREKERDSKGDSSDRGNDRQAKGDTKTEKNMESSGANHVGFESGKSKSSRVSVDKMLNATKGAREALMDPTKTVYLSGMASRFGNDAANQKLSEARVNGLVDYLKTEYGAQCKFELDATGSEHAQLIGDKKAFDNPAERLVLINFTGPVDSGKPGGDPAKPLEVPPIQVPGVPEVEVPVPAAEAAKLVADHVLTEKIAAEIAGHAAAELLGGILEGAIFQAEALGKLAETSKEADMLVRQGVYIREYANAFAELTGENAASAVESYLSSDMHLSIKQIEEMKDVSALDGKAAPFYDAIKATARIDAVREINKLGEHWATEFARQHPDNRERRQFVVESLRRER